MKKFLAIEELREDLEGNNEYADLDTNEYTSIVLESDAAIQHAVLQSNIYPSFALEAFDDFDTSDDVLENKGDFIQQMSDMSNDSVTELFAKIRNPIANLFTGVNRILDETDKLMSRVHRLDREPSFNGSITSNKLIKLRSKGHYPKSAKELIKEMEELLELGEWFINDYRKGIDEIAYSFINLMRDKSVRRWFNQEDVVDYFVHAYEKHPFPVPPGSKDIRGDEKLYSEMVDAGILGDAQTRSFVVDLKKVNNFVKGWEKMKMINNQWCKVDKYQGNISGDARISIDLPTRDELARLLELNEKVVSLAKRLSNEMKAEHSQKIQSRIGVSFADMWDVVINAAAPISQVRYFMTNVRRAMIEFVQAYAKWSTNSYSSYISNAYQVGKEVNKLVELSIKHYR